MKALRLPIHVRWMLIKSDIKDIVEIERLSYSTPWTAEDFSHCLNRHNFVGVVAEINHRVVGFLICEMHKKTIRLVNLAVHPKFKRKGVASQLVDDMVQKLSSGRYERIMAEIRETNLPAQLFFRSKNFRAYSIEKGLFEDTGEDGYIFEYWSDV